jgi:YbgC/YbaW family acyl-CoA thioester hydrolase
MLMLLERGRWAALEKHMSYDEYVTRELTAVVRHVDVSYSRSAKAGDEFRIRTGLVSIGNTSFTVKQTAHNQRDELICEATVVYVTLGSGGRPAPVPEHWRTIFLPWD